MAIMIATHLSIFQQAKIHNFTNKIQCLLIMSNTDVNFHGDIWTVNGWSLDDL